MAKGLVWGYLVGSLVLCLLGMVISIIQGPAEVGSSPIDLIILSLIVLWFIFGVICVIYFIKWKLSWKLVLLPIVNVTLIIFLMLTGIVLGVLAAIGEIDAGNVANSSLIYYGNLIYYALEIAYILYAFDELRIANVK